MCVCVWIFPRYNTDEPIKNGYGETKYKYRLVVISVQTSGKKQKENRVFTPVQITVVNS